LAAFWLAHIAPASAQDEGPPPARDYVSCGHFETQADAQAALDSGTLDENGRASLDGDGDGIACEVAFGLEEPRPVGCDNFMTQADAQWYLDTADAADPALLDPDGDGIACEEAFGLDPDSPPPARDYVSCGHFDSQERAQEMLDSGLLDENGQASLDGDGDGIACEVRWGEPTSGNVRTAPTGVTALPKTGSGLDAGADHLPAVMSASMALTLGAAMAIRKRGSLAR